LMRAWPALQRERFARAGAATPGGPTSILRWRDEPGSGSSSTIEQRRRGVGGSEDTAPSKYRQRLLWAGYHEPRAVLLFLGAKVGLAVLGGIGYFLHATLVLRVVPVPRLLATSLILAVIGFFLPDFWLRNRIQARQREI